MAAVRETIRKDNHEFTAHDGVAHQFKRADAQHHEQTTQRLASNSHNWPVSSLGCRSSWPSAVEQQKHGPAPSQRTNWRSSAEDVPLLRTCKSSQFTPPSNDSSNVGGCDAPCPPSMFPTVGWMGISGSSLSAQLSGRPSAFKKARNWSPVAKMIAIINFWLRNVGPANKHYLPSGSVHLCFSNPILNVSLCFVVLVLTGSQCFSASFLCASLVLCVSNLLL